MAQAVRVAVAPTQSSFLTLSSKTQTRTWSVFTSPTAIKIYGTRTLIAFCFCPLCIRVESIEKTVCVRVSVSVH